MDQGNYGNKMDFGMLGNLHIILYMDVGLGISKQVQGQKKGYFIRNNLKGIFKKNDNGSIYSF